MTAAAASVELINIFINSCEYIFTYSVFCVLVTHSHFDVYRRETSFIRLKKICRAMPQGGKR